jgi:hypothetical protein
MILNVVIGFIMNNRILVFDWEINDGRKEDAHVQNKGPDVWVTYDGRRCPLSRNKTELTSV